MQDISTLQHRGHFYIALTHTLLLCSYGLSGEVADNFIATILSETTGNQARVDRLIAAALEAGGKDNVTVIVLTPWQSKV